MKKKIIAFLFPLFCLCLSATGHANCQSLWLAIANLSKTLEADLLIDTEEMNNEVGSNDFYVLDDFEVVGIDWLGSQTWRVYYRPYWIIYNNEGGTEIGKLSLLLNHQARVKNDCSVQIID